MTRPTRTQPALRGTSTDWRDRALCVGADPEIFYPVDTGPDAPARAAEAKRVCAFCPVRLACLADVLGWEDPARRWGVIGGTTAAERTTLFDRNRRRAGRLTSAVSVAPLMVGGEAA